MKHKILNLVYESSESRFVKRKWNIVYINQTQTIMYEIKLSI